MFVFCSYSSFLFCMYPVRGRYEHSSTILGCGISFASRGEGGVRGRVENCRFDPLFRDSPVPRAGNGIFTDIPTLAGCFLHDRHRSFSGSARSACGLLTLEAAAAGRFSVPPIGTRKKCRENHRKIIGKSSETLSLELQTKFGKANINFTEFCLWNLLRPVIKY